MGSGVSKRLSALAAIVALLGQSVAPAFVHAVTGSAIADPAAALLNSIGSASAFNRAGVDSSLKAFSSPEFFSTFSPSCFNAGNIGAEAYHCSEGNDEEHVADELTCKMIQTSGRVSKSKVEDLIDKLEQNIDADKCVVDQANNAAQQVGCMKTLADNLASELGQLQTAFGQNLSRMRGEAGQIDAAIQDRASQGNELLSILGGDEKGSGRTGLLKTRDELAQLSTQVGTMVEGIQGQYQDVELKRKNYQEAVRKREVVEAMSCFNDKAFPGAKCKENGPDVSAAEHLVCRYEQNQQVVNKQVQQDAFTKEKARSAGADLKSALAGLFGSAPKSAAIPKDQKQFEASMNDPVGIQSQADVDRAIEGLRRFDGKGLGLTKFMKDAFAYCFTKAKSTVDRARGLASNDLGQLKAGVEAAERKANTAYGDALTRIADQYDKAFTGLTGIHAPLLLDACKVGKPEVQIACLKDAQNNLEGIRKGTSKAAAMTITLRGKDPKANLKVSCNGVDGCITALQNYKREIDRDITRLQDAGKQYREKATASVKGFVNEMRGKAGPKIKEIQSKITALNDKLKAMKIIKSFNPAAMPAEEIKLGPDGLPEDPKNLMALIAGGATPPMPNIQDPKVFEAIEAEVKTKVNKADEKLKAAQNKLDVDLPALVDSCGSEGLEKLAEATQKDIDAFNENSCYLHDNYCGAKATNPVTKLGDTLSAALGTSEIDTSAVDGLESGIAGLCSSKEAADADKTESDEKQTLLKNEILALKTRRDAIEAERRTARRDKLTADRHLASAEGTRDLTEAQQRQAERDGRERVETANRPQITAIDEAITRVENAIAAAERGRANAERTMDRLNRGRGRAPVPEGT